MGCALSRTGDECNPDAFYQAPALGLAICFALRTISSTTCVIGAVASIEMPFCGMSSFV